MLVTSTNTAGTPVPGDSEQRLTLQPLLPKFIDDENMSSTGYGIYPFHTLGTGKICNGYESLATRIADHPAVLIDGFSGVLWHEVRKNLSQIFEQRGSKVNWIDVSEALKPSEIIESLIKPFMGESDSLWGRRSTLSLIEFFDLKKLAEIKGNGELTIVYGTGASLVSISDATIVYIDIPKNEIQYRMRAGAITNLGADQPQRSGEMYKRFYFVDWVVLGAHKKSLLSKAEIFADAQWIDDINWINAADLNIALKAMGTSVYRVRPWFEAGAWGGQWMKDKFHQLNKDEVNYAWSFELIVPENGIVFESDGYLLELSFDYLMFADNRSILGKHAALFGDEFPIRFDFLDTWDGGNLSIQCHPSLQYIRSNFGETITQDETYYILDCKEDAGVYLGFQDNIEPEHFREVLETSRKKNEAVDIENYVQLHPAKKHDLFLIPNGTVHSAGINNVVLEISATPYIFTFKMYDWVRLDLNGEPRAINLQHAFNNLKFDRKGEKVKTELISKPSVIDKGDGWQLVHLPTHAEHFYDVHRVEFDDEVEIETNDSCHVLMVVEGGSVTLETAGGKKSVFHYAETFVVPAAAGRYRVKNNGKERIKLIKAFLKEEIGWI
ncbi:MAG: hypothetical protein EOO02_10265 [Chitinophagaceae bacterium]|nr:MAG: hypothetical protein EOO02_10265 [Chitinophagaceae bacterium]